MTDFDTLPVPAPTGPDPWEADLARLRERFPKANASVLICIHALQQEVDVSLDDMRARAAMHGIRVTAASLQAGRRALGLSPPMAARVRRVEAVDGALEADGQQNDAALSVGEVAEERLRARRRSAPQGGSRAGGVEQMLREFVAKADEERQRLREAVRRVIELVDEALE